MWGIFHAFAREAHFHPNFIVLIGVAIFAGIIGGRIFQRLRIPQVVGYIIVGLIVGDMGLKLISAEVVNTLKPLNFFALGILGFMIGGELKGDMFRKYGRQFFTMVIGEGMGAFFLVTPLIWCVTWYCTKDARISAAVALVLGAIASATDPASTLQVFWEYRTRGLLTTAAIAMVALDDALALALYGLATSLAGILVGGHSSTIAGAAVTFVYHIAGSVGLGAVFGLVMAYSFKYFNEEGNILPFAVGLVLLVIGLAQAMGLDIIMATMACGLTTVNLVPKRSEEMFVLVKRFAPPIYVLFFVFVGARLNVSHMSPMIWGLVIVYLLGRSLGKMAGAYTGARLSGAAERVRKYLGLCLFSQAGVAVGLAIMASQSFSESISNMIIIVVGTTTLVVQLIGPAFTKLAVKRAGEMNLNVTEEDIIHSLKVKDVMEKVPKTIGLETPIEEVLRMFSDNLHDFFFVEDGDGRITGLVTFKELKNVLSGEGISRFLIACDIMEKIPAWTVADIALADALERMRSLGLLFMPVTQKEGLKVLAGVLERGTVDRVVAEELMKRQKQAEE